MPLTLADGGDASRSWNWPFFYSHHLPFLWLPWRHRTAWMRTACCSGGDLRVTRAASPRCAWAKRTEQVRKRRWVWGWLGWGRGCRTHVGRLSPDQRSVLEEIIIKKKDGCGRRFCFGVGGDHDEFGCKKRWLRCKRASFSLCRLIREEARWQLRPATGLKPPSSSNHAMHRDRTSLYVLGHAAPWNHNWCQNHRGPFQLHIFKHHALMLWSLPSADSHGFVMVVVYHILPPTHTSDCLWISSRRDWHPQWFFYFYFLVLIIYRRYHQCHRDSQVLGFFF